MKKYFERIYNKGIDSFYNELKESLKSNKKSFIVTANPETFMYGKKDEVINNIILDKKTIVVPDGIGIVKASNMLGYNIKERIPGIDIATKLLEYGNELSKTIYFFGAKKEVVEKLVEKVKKDFPKLNVEIICEVDTNKMLELLHNHKIDFAITDTEINSSNVEVKELLTINNIFVSKAPLKISDVKELENLNCILNLENTKATQQLKEILKKSNISIHADMMCDATEIRVEAVKRNMGIAYVIKEAVKNELVKKELYEVELPIDLPSIKLNLVYLSGELSKIDKKFIKEYLKK